MESDDVFLRRLDAAARQALQEISATYEASLSDLFQPVRWSWDGKSSAGERRADLGLSLLGQTPRRHRAQRGPA